MLHLLWDLKLKVGHSVRSVDAADRARQEGHDDPHRVPRGALAVGRREAVRRRACAASARRSSPAPRAEFVAAKLAERDERHIRMGDSRYVVEPNVKDGKGGLRDLHTLYWIGKYVHGVERPADLVGAGPADRRRVPPLRPRRALLLGGALPSPPARRARRGAAELRLSAARSPRSCTTPTGPGNRRSSASCNSISCNAKTVGDLTGVFLAQLDEQLGKKGFRFALADASAAGPSGSAASCSTAAGSRSRPTISSAQDPVRLIELFALAARERLEIHPAAMRAATPRRRADRPQRCATTRAPTPCSWTC